MPLGTSKTKRSATKAPDQTAQLLAVVTQMLQVQQEQMKVICEQASIFRELVSAWTKPVPVNPLPPTRDVQDMLDDLEDRAFDGDDEARQIFADPEKLKSYLHQFKS